ncbi:NAD-dependent protein deacetylase hst2 [Schizosaccharomyces pombe]|uniref:NAD-dependent protein deacetylase hst2 n=1 Tax=Schizosaccharomyces pombe (strain 972 / ATCC 24843) TaxID=284812 RepID=HST2_SCHPO|nr:Sir2 family histone deacetylase Hst2 [Schizosaccharomyces pombe]Q9USN7.1 RecName: Full=NAD-dependent protein deacetylase hst2; AltName: Full=Homologous to sir2 protein 2; AltName: Full=Regulatory protein SIR2 homolog 2 [Schizosaccharomyces pombe 972h-]CAB58129.1 Sir2 family histone deacetylase Hst2 [Schizosaccharomyces pombe]|eukprot:NP_588147.1 Sir2 family histone deacetylase Hst2 [Schizosaccharomyces pombe]
MVKNTVKHVDSSKHLEKVASLIKEGKVKKICVMVGAGISTAAGIPDFRSPETGIYNNLQRFNLPYAEAVFDLSYFRKNPRPFYELAHELMPEKYRPTYTHYFIRLLHDKRLLQKCYTQNIDTLERLAGVPDKALIEAHGSFQYSRCIECYEMAETEYVRACIMQKQVPKCNSCKGLIKPMIVFYGEGLPMRFFEHMEKDTKVCDMALVIGTSLLVHPFADLPEIVPNKCQRVLINREPAGDFGERKKDIMILGDCDSQVRALCKLLGWSDELEKLIDTSVETLTEEISLLSVDSTIEKNASEQKKDDNSVNPFTKIEEKKKDEVTLLVSDDE